MKKVIIVNPINYWFDTLRPPFGLLTIATKFVENGLEVIWIDADVTRDHNEVNMNVKQHLDADLIVIGGMHTAYRYIKGFCTKHIWRRHDAGQDECISKIQYYRKT